MRELNRCLLGPMVLVGLWLGGCKSDKALAEPAAPEPRLGPEAPSSPPARVASPAQPATIGKPAPEFSLPSLEGKPVRLADFRGKTVVLEWFNPECPFVKASHSKGSLKGLAGNYHGKGDVVWLAINSGGPGRQGHGVEKNRAGQQMFELEHPILLDETGTVGKSYGATNTPHLFIVNEQGTLVYRGAIDNSPDGEGESAEGGKLVNYVSQALEEIAAGKAVSVPETKAYGCSVKYPKS